MTDYAVGKDVLSYCNACKLTLSHTVVAMRDTKTIAKVQCNTCQALHAFRSKSQARTTAKKTRSKAHIVPVDQLWKDAMSTTNKKSVAYSIRTKFNVGDIIDHSKFGPGIVQAFSDNDKIEVLFNSDIRVLVHNK